MNVWKAPLDVVTMLDDVKERHHLTRLDMASIGIAFDDSKPFVKNKINLGKVTKFNAFNKLWQDAQHDFCFTIPFDLWVTVLNANQREAYLDLQLTRCEVEYYPDVIQENGKKRVLKDDWGRVQYTDKVKFDDAGIPKWKVLPLDLEVYIKNVRRYGLWLDELTELKEAIDQTI